MKSLMWYQVKKLNCERRVMCEINQGLKRLNFELIANMVMNIRTDLSDYVLNISIPSDGAKQRNIWNSTD